MFTNPHSLGQLAHEHHREVLAEARRHQLARQARPAPRVRAVPALTRRLLAAFGKSDPAPARVPHVIQPAEQS